MKSQTGNPEAARVGGGGKRVRSAGKFVQKSFRMGGAQQFPWAKALATADAIEDEELTRKLALQK